MPSSSSAGPARPRRDEIWYFDPDPGCGSEIEKCRPGIVIDSDQLVTHPTRLVVPITHWDSKHEGRESHVHLVPDHLNCLEKESVADTQRLTCLSVTRLREKIGKLRADDLDNVASAIAIVVEAPA